MEHSTQQGDRSSRGTKGDDGVLPAEATAGMPAELDGSKETGPVEDGMGAPAGTAEGLQPHSDGWEVDDDDAWSDHDDAADARPAVPLFVAPFPPAVAAASAPGATVTADAAALGVVGTDDLSSEGLFHVTMVHTIAAELKQELRRLESILRVAAAQLGTGDHDSCLPAPGLASDTDLEGHEGLAALLMALPAHAASLTVAAEGVVAEKGSLEAQVKQLEVRVLVPRVGCTVQVLQS